MNKRKLFVGNLKFTVTDTQLSKLFSQYGDVLSVRVMEGKGYAFVEMSNEEQAQKIKNTLSEEIFEGRRLLIDDVPTKGSSGQKPGKNPSESRETRQYSPSKGSGLQTGRMETRQPGRSGYASQASQQEPVRHLVDVTDEFMKGSGPSRISPGKPTPPNKGPARQDKYPSEKRPYEKPVQKGSVNHNDTKEKPAFGASVSDNRFRDSDRIKPSGSGIKRSENQKPKKIKEKPPKNPHPYQGSKKSGKPAQSKEEPKKPAGDTDDSDKRNYLRYWATISKNKQE